ncbi:MAG: hypothetical protein MUP97_01340 [Acidimicrobiia bacterium]|nr:hypothetical protein [Acidimicrobiia bacterium]
MVRAGRRAGTAALLVFGCVAALVSPVAAARAAKAPPAKWDPRILELVRFVEKSRGLEFEHPIPVEFLADAAFEKEVVSDDTDLTKADRALGRRYSGDLRALGLVGPDFDFNAASNALDAQGIVGFYDQDTKKMVIRGQDLDDTDVRVTVVHELTHALQDQHFGLTRLQDATKSSGEDLALTTLVEGDAVWVEEDYVATLPQAEQDAYYAAAGSTGGDSPGGSAGATPEVGSVADVSPILERFFSAPYDLGYWFVDYLRAHGLRAGGHRTGGSTKGVDRALRHPPPSDEQVLDPVAFLEHEHPSAPRAPKLEAGETKRGRSDQLGVLTLYFLLASRLDPRTALAAVTGWKGDTYVGFARDDQPCIRAAITTDDPREAKELAGALEQWGTKGPAGAASVERNGADVELDACARAETALPTTQTLDDASIALGSRYLNYGQFEANDGLSRRDVRCLADLYSTDLELTEIFNTTQPEDATPEQEALIEQRMLEYADACGLEVTA